MEKRNKSLQRIAKSVGKVAAMAGPASLSSAFKDQMLRDALHKHGNQQPKSAEWAMKVIDSVYKRISIQVSHDVP